MTGNVWVIDDDQSIRWVLDRALSKAGIPISVFNTADQAMHHLHIESPLAILTDIRMQGMSGLEFLEQVRESHPNVPIIVMTAHSDLDTTVSSFEKGALEYLAKPFDVDEVVGVVRRAVAHAGENREQQPVNTEPTPEIIGKAPAMQEVFRAIGRLASTNASVLITGPSGSGKELVANSIHRHSPRESKPFIALNVAAIPDELVESELFGHEKGAFTGANNQRIGRFEQANEGTLFLDEIGDMPASAQTRLLRVLSESEFYRVGGHQTVKVDVRIVAATHQNLESLVTKGNFREDLFHRLNVIRVHVPSLSERRADIPLLAKHFLEQAAKDLNDEPKRLSPEAEKFMTLLPWPGNVRQLENTCRWLHVMGSTIEILKSDFPPELITNPVDANNHEWEKSLKLWALASLENESSAPLLEIANPIFEKIMIESALQKTNGRKQEAAKLLGWGRNTLTRKLQELDI